MYNRKVYVSVGSNLGNREFNCRIGIDGIKKSKNSIILSMSKFYKTSPMDYQDQNWFVNAVVKVKTILNPKDFLNELFLIQRIVGRKSGGVRFGPRILDLDILFYENRILNLPELVIPHPRIQRRRFVLIPFCDIDPCFIHPVFGITVKSLLEKLSDKQQMVLEI